MSSKSFLSTYYALLAYVVYSQFWSVLDFKGVSPKAVWFGHFFSNLLGNVWISISIGLLCLVLFAICIFRHHVILGYTAALSLIFFFSIKFSFGKVNHNNHIWILSAFLIPLIRAEKPFSERRNDLIVGLCQMLLLAHYFSSGLWKLRGLSHPLNFTSINQMALNHIAYAVAEGQGPPSVVLEFLQSSPNMPGLGYLLVLLFQLSAVIPIIKKKWLSFWGLAAVGFHCTTGIVLGIWFMETVLAVFLFLILVTRDEHKSGCA